MCIAKGEWKLQGEIWRVNENFLEAPKEMAVWDLIEDTSPLNTWDGDLYNEKDPSSIAMHVARPYKRIKWVVDTKKVGNFQIQRDEKKEIDFWQQMNVANKIVFNMWIGNPLQLLEGVWNS